MSTDVVRSRSDQRTGADVSRKRQIGFYVSGGLFLLLCIVVFGLVPEPAILPFVFTGWFLPDLLGAHQLHEIMASAFFWSIIVGMIFTLIRPRQMISALRQTTTILVVMALVLLVSGNLMEPLVMIAVLLLLAGITAVLHPARHRLLRPQGRIQPWLAGLTVLAAVPLLDYAFGHLQLQMGAVAADTHAAQGHWALMSAYALAIVVCGLLASLRADGWRVPAWSAGILTALMGVAAFVLPGQASALSNIWGVLALVWGVAFIAAAEVTNALRNS